MGTVYFVGGCLFVGCVFCLPVCLLLIGIQTLMENWHDWRKAHKITVEESDSGGYQVVE